MKHYPHAVTAAIACTTITTSVFADDEIYQLEPVVVTATRTTQTANENVAPMVVISEKDIEQSQARDMAELLRAHAGIEIGRNGGIGQVTSVFIRGAESDHVLLMIDGVKINPGTVNTPNWEYITPSMIERIEVVKGPRSSLYGSEAIGGVVNIITKRSKQERKIIASVGGGAQNTKKVNVGYYDQAGNAHLGVNIEGFDTEGFPSRVDSDIEGGHDNQTINGHLGYKRGNFDTDISIWNTSGTTNYEGYEFTPDNLAGSPVARSQDFENSTLALTFKSTIKKWSQTLKLSRNDNEIRQKQVTKTVDWSDLSLVESMDFTVTKRYALDWQNDFRIGKHHLLTAGLYAAEEETASMSFGEGYDDTTTSSAAFVQEHMKLGNHNLVLAGRLTHFETFGNNTSYNVDYGYSITQNLALKTGIGTGYRAPSALDRFGFGGNEDLDPETSVNGDFGVTWQFDKSQSIDVSVFYNEIDNLIMYVDPDGFFGPTLGKNQNIGTARIRGSEINYRYSSKQINFYLSGIIQDPRDLDKNEQLLRRAKRGLTARFDFQPNSTRYGVEWITSSERKDINDFGQIVTLAGYGILNLYVTEQIQKQWELKLKVENLLDKDYQLVSGYNTQGLLALVEIKYSTQ